jgi:hypothetical protein
VELLISRCTDSALRRRIETALSELKADRTAGDHVPKKYWPKDYVKNWRINNLYKKDLGRDWRLTYTLVFDGAGVGVYVLEILAHKEYDRRFGYRTT